MYEDGVYAVLYEGKVLYKSSSYDDAYYKILDLQGNSVSYALKYGGYKIVDLLEEDPVVCAGSDPCWGVNYDRLHRQNDWAN